MKYGEKIVFTLIGLVLLVSVVWSSLRTEQKHDREIPFYTTATPDLARKAMDIYRGNGCKSCHTLWTLQDMLQFVPAPMLDGIGSLHTETWLYEYLSAPNPQKILPSRLKAEYRMPSYVTLPESERHLLAQYLASLKVQDWYFEQTKKAEYEKLTGQENNK